VKVVRARVEREKERFLCGVCVGYLVYDYVCGQGGGV